MRVLVVKDGTVPILVAKVLATDKPPGGWPEGVGDIDHEYAELFDIDEEDPEALDIAWADSMGFTVYATTIAQWFEDRQADPNGGPISYSDGQFIQSDIGHGEDEQWYAHLFILRAPNGRNV